MRIVQLCTYARGGAGVAALRLHRGLKSLGTESVFLTSEPHPEARALAQTPKWTWKKETKVPATRYFSTNLKQSHLAKQVRNYRPDIVHLHWIGDGFVPIESIAEFEAPIVWTQHDAWAATGGCHYPGTCRNFEVACGCCPALPPELQAKNDLSHRIWNLKNARWPKRTFSLVSPSAWLAREIQSSQLFKNEPVDIIPYGLDTEVFRPRDKKAAREILGLPPDRFLILFGAVAATTDKRKGFAELCQALQTLPAPIAERCVAVVFGDSVAPPMALPCIALGRLQDDLSLSVIYSACDLFVIPSLEDNFPNTVLEAMACGLPVAGFAVGGIPEAVRHGENGLLVPPGDVQALAQQIEAFVADPNMTAHFGARSRERAVSEFASSTQAQKYQSLYEGVLSRP